MVRRIGFGDEERRRRDEAAARERGRAERQARRSGRPVEPPSPASVARQERPSSPSAQASPWRRNAAVAPARTGFWGAGTALDAVREMRERAQAAADRASQRAASARAGVAGSSSSSSSSSSAGGDAKKFGGMFVIRLVAGLIALNIVSNSLNEVMRLVGFIVESFARGRTSDAIALATGNGVTLLIFLAAVYVLYSAVFGRGFFATRRARTPSQRRL